jgi:sigma-B regulation protein RsbU (phosphoserine phosphatase)
MCAQLPLECYVTFFLAFLEPHAHRLSYVTAGHPPPLLLRPDAEPVFLESTGAPIGMRIPVPLRSESVEFHPGSLLAIWSDGIPEAIRVGERPMRDFTEERLVAQIRELQRLPLETILDRVFHDSDEFVGSPRAQDDRTLLLLRRES